MASNDENEYVFRFKCDCGEIHEVSYPRRNNVNIRVRNCKSRVILHWDGKGFAIVKQDRDHPNYKKPERRHWIHDHAIGGIKYNERLFWGRYGWPLRLAVTLAVRMWRWKIRIVGWESIRNYWVSGTHGNYQRDITPPSSDKDFMKSGRVYPEGRDEEGLRGGRGEAGGHNASGKDRDSTDARSTRGSVGRD